MSLTTILIIIIAALIITSFLRYTFAIIVSAFSLIALILIIFFSSLSLDLKLPGMSEFSKLGCGEKVVIGNEEKCKETYKEIQTDNNTDKPRKIEKTNKIVKSEAGLK